MLFPPGTYCRALRLIETYVLQDGDERVGAGKSRDITMSVDGGIFSEYARTKVRVQTNMLYTMCVCMYGMYVCTYMYVCIVCVFVCRSSSSSLLHWV